MVVIAAAFVASGISAGLRTGENTAASERMHEVANAVAARIGPPSGPVVVHSTGSVAAGDDRAELILALEERGYDVSAGADPDRFGTRQPSRSAAARSLFVTAGSREFDAARFAYTLLAASGPARAFPTAAPPMQNDEDAATYLARLRSHVDSAEYRQLHQYLVSPYPIAVFAATPQ